jgi:pimeloyl-ACP methyl ester carboxylesterase
VKSLVQDLGGPVHYLDFGGEGEPFVLIHGLGGSSTNWLAVAGPLTKRFRVYALDLAGFGRTPLTGRETTIASNAALVGRFVDEVARAPAILAGNSMGGLISLRVAAERPSAVKRLVLVNAALPIPRGVPLDRAVAVHFVVRMAPFLSTYVMRKRAARSTPARLTEETLRLCGVDPRKLAPEVLAGMTAITEERASMPWVHEAFILAARSLFVTNLDRRRFEATVRAVRAPTLVMHGTRDRLVSMEAARSLAKLRPDFRLAVLEGVGHTPQLEIPEPWLSLVLDWLDDIDGTSAMRAAS